MSRVPAYVIHLLRSEARLENIEKRIPSDRIAWRFFDAIECPGNGPRGCFLSHMGVLHEAKRRRLPFVLILEDDVVIKPHFTVPPQPWPAPVISLSASSGDFVHWTPSASAGFMMVHHFFACTAGMLVSASAYDALLAIGERALAELVAPEADIDLYSRYAQEVSGSVAVTVPFMCGVMETPSTICSFKTEQNDAAILEATELALTLVEVSAMA
jgi:hypothetical protein